LQASARREELRALLREGPVDGERLRGALQIIREDGALDLAREAVGTEVRRAVAEAEPLPGGVAQDALIHLARYLAARCGAAA
jgi:geranylgeranyl pyrophosphate synthase